MGAREWGVAAKGGWNIFIGMRKMFRDLIIMMNVQELYTLKRLCYMVCKLYLNKLKKKRFIIVYRNHTKKNY